MATPEDELEALMQAAEFAEDVRDKLMSPEDRERLEAAGFEVTRDAWGDPVAKLPYEDAYIDAPLALRVLDAIGEEAVSASCALYRMGFKEQAVALRRDALVEYRARRTAAEGPSFDWVEPPARKILD